MRDNNSYILFHILKSVFCGNRMSHADEQPLIEASLVDIIKLAAKHDIAHLVAYGLLDNLKDENNKQQLQQIVFRAVYRFEKMNYELRQVCNVLEQAEIPFLPLKGSVIRQYYPEPWMRTSCDIDILIHESDLKRTVDLLIEQNGYSYQGKGSHDVSLFSPNGIHIELHYNLVETGIFDSAHKILEKVWETSKRRVGFTYWHEMSDDMFYFYHIAHMAKHFVNGGCGIRPIIDLWILDNMSGVDKAKRDELLEQGELLKFANSVRDLSGVWLDGLQHNEITKQMEGYILHGGVYGSAENYVAVQQQKKGGKLRYAFSKIFLPYDVIKYHYPILEKHKWMTPIMEIRRWCKLIFCGHLTRSVNELRYSGTIKNEQGADMRCFLENIGL